MNPTQAYCGIECKTCLLYRATLENNEQEKINLALSWGKKYNRPFNITDMVCYGCKSEQVFILCQSCDIKTCNQSHKVDVCQSCERYPCQRILKFQEHMRLNNPEMLIRDSMK